MTTKPTLTLSALEKIDGAADPEPFTLGLKSKIVTFPDPFALSIEESERLMADLEGTTSIKATLNRWLSEEDAELIIKNLSVRKTRVLLAQVRKHYASFLGDEGEDSASATA